MFSKQGESDFRNTLIRYLNHKKHKELTSIVENSILKFEWYDHDNLDGGFDIYNLSILIPLELYVIYEEKIEEYSQDLLSVVQHMTKHLRDWIGAVVINMNSDLHNSHAHISTEEMLKKINHQYACDLWNKAVNRLNCNDNEGAITIASSLMEDIMKFLLDELKIDYSDSDDIPDLYSKLSKELNVHPSQHTEKIFSQILGGCFSVIQGLGAFRNKTGDAHGRGKKNYKPAKRHAELMVNLSGVMATFLISTFDNINKEKLKE